MSRNSVNVVRESRGTIESFVEGLITRGGSRAGVLEALRAELDRFEDDCDEDEEDEEPTSYRFLVTGELEEEIDDADVDARAEELKSVAEDYGFTNVDVEWEEL